MAEDDLDQLRGVLLAWAKLHPEIRWHSDGRPNAEQIAAAMGLHKGTVSKLLRGRMSKRAGVLRPKSDGYRITPEMLAGVMRLLSLLTEEDAWAVIRKAERVPAFPTRGR